jgi:hypothetical protein
VAPRQDDPGRLALGVVAVARLRGRALAAFLLVAGAAALGFALYYQRHLRHGLAARALRRRAGRRAHADVALSRRAVLDRSYGLLPIAPVFLLALAGVRAGCASAEAWPHLLLGLAVLAPLVSWRMWWGGQCPPARFLVPLLPLSRRARAAARRSRAAASRAGSRDSGAGAVLRGGAVADPAARILLNRGNRPTRLWAALSDGTAIGDYLPSLTHAVGSARARVRSSGWPSGPAVRSRSQWRAPARASTALSGASPFAVAVLCCWGLIDWWWARYGRRRLGRGRISKPPDLDDTVGQPQLPALAIVRACCRARRARAPPRAYLSIDEAQTDLEVSADVLGDVHLDGPSRCASASQALP